MRIERVSDLSQPEFLARYVEPNQPVIVVDAMQLWPARQKWTPAYLTQVLGELEVQVYNELFDLVNVSTLEAYFATNFNRLDDNLSSDYVRWYSQLKNVDFFWSNQAFARLAADWSTPAFLPQEGYIVPGNGGLVDAQSSLFPYRGLFISGRGARTRLHRDPWTTSAMLCQFYGSKQVTMYPPEQACYLMNGSAFADPLRPDRLRFPELAKATPRYIDVLQPGEVLFIPSNWLHHVESLEDSISVTWNFIHAAGRARLCAHLQQYPQDSELDVLRFFLADLVPPHADAAQIIARLEQGGVQQQAVPEIEEFVI